MKMKMSSLAAAIAAAVAMGAAEQAAASVYAGSYLDIEALTVTIVPVGTGLTEPVITGYQFTTTATATLNGTAAPTDTQTCSTIGTACSNTAPVLESVANAPGGTDTRLAGDFSWFGPGTDTFSNSASEIGDATLSTGNPTTAQQISEVEVQASGVGIASTVVSSETQITFTFTVAAGTADLAISFQADPDLFVAVDTDNLLASLATASSEVKFGLLSSNGTNVQWQSNGETLTTGNYAIDKFNFSTCVGALCYEDLDPENLNSTISLPAGNPEDASFSDSRDGATVDGGLQSYTIRLTGLAAGNYSLSLSSKTFARAEQSVPEPGILSLLGVGLLGLAGTRRKMRK